MAFDIFKAPDGEEPSRSQSTKKLADMTIEERRDKLREDMKARCQEAIRMLEGEAVSYTDTKGNKKHPRKMYIENSDGTFGVCVKFGIARKDKLNIFGNKTRIKRAGNKAEAVQGYEQILERLDSDTINDVLDDANEARIAAAKKRRGGK